METFHQEILPRLPSMGYDYCASSYRARVDDFMPQPVSLDSESTDLDYTGMSSRSSVRASMHHTQSKHTNLSQSPIVFAPAFNCRISKEVDFGPPPPDTPGGDAKEPETSEPVKYSPIFKMGLFFSVCFCLDVLSPV